MGRLARVARQGSPPAPHSPSSLCLWGFASSSVWDMTPLMLEISQEHVVFVSSDLS